ncbi:MAG: hypothetical protein AABY26_03830 [Nanoarchaeota archaeon]
MPKNPLPKKECSNCDFFQKKELLAKNHKIATKEYCQRFHQELFSHQACPKFRYNKDVEIEIETIYGTIGTISGMIGLASVIALIISIVMKSNFAENISLVVVILSMISLATFMTINEKAERRILYGE